MNVQNSLKSIQLIVIILGTIIVTGQDNYRFVIDGLGAQLGGGSGIYSNTNASGFLASDNLVGFSAHDNEHQGFSSSDNSSGYTATSNSNDGFSSTYNSNGFSASYNSSDGIISYENTGYAGYFTSPSTRNDEAVHITHNKPTGLEIKLGGFGRIGADDSYVVYLNYGNGARGTESFQIRDGSGIYNALIVYENGNATFNGVVTATDHTDSSDRRYKKSITPINNSLLNLHKINGVRYKWDQEKWSDRNFSDEPQIGFIAQELEEIYPELIHTDKEGYKSVAYNKMTAVLVEAVKELHEKLIKENDELRSENENIKKKLQRIDMLEKRLAILERGE